MCNRYFLPILFISAVFILFSYKITVIARNSGPYAGGHGNLFSDGELRTFSFHARTFKNGITRGNLVVKNRELGIRVKAKIDCLDIIGNQATMSGFITQVNGDDPSLIGDKIWFRVVDNGEGQRNKSDLITLVIAELDEPGDPEDCEEDFELELMNIFAGNIQVIP